MYIREWKLWSRDWYSKSIKCKCGRLLKIIALFGKVRKLLLIQDEISVCAQLLINGNFRYCTFVYIVVTTVLMDHQGSELCELYSVWGITLIIHSENVSISNLPVYQLLTLQSLTNLISLCPNILEVVQKVIFKVPYWQCSVWCRLTSNSGNEKCWGFAYPVLSPTNETIFQINAGMGCL